MYERSHPIADDPSAPRNEDAYRRVLSDDAGEDALVHRAKVVAVLRKAEELMRTSNPAPTDRERTRRALQLAAGRVGLSISEYDALVVADPELVALEQQVVGGLTHDRFKLR